MARVEEVDCTCPAAPPVSAAAAVTPSIAPAISFVPTAARCTFWAMSRVAAPCCSTAAAMEEALHDLAAQGVHLDAMRVRAFPFSQEVAAFVRGRDQVFVVEQNRDGQLRTLLLRECDLDPARLVAVPHYDGAPITARFITQAITAHLQPQRENVA